MLLTVPDQAADRAAALVNILDQLSEPDIAACETAHRDQETVQERESL